MEVGKTYCTKCGKEVHGCYCDNCDPHVEVKLLSIKELREQFENIFKNSELRLNDSGQYWSFKTYDKWEGFLECARANNILKDGE